LNNSQWQEISKKHPYWKAEKLKPDRKTRTGLQMILFNGIPSRPGQIMPLSLLSVN